jgi:DNA-binding NtrC family response regulator
MSETRESRVMIVDPDSEYASRVSNALSDGDCDVETVEGIKQAVRRLREADFGCVIVNVSLPEIRGYDAVAVLKALLPDTQVIVVATHNTPELEARVRKEDVFFYHLKCFDISELLMAVKDALRKVRSSRSAGRN